MPYKGGKRKKSRTHKVPEVDPNAGVPKSFVVKRGKVDTSVKELVRDFREVMLPHTAERLKERKSNTLKDFVAVAGTLHVSHLLMFTQTEQGNVNLRIGRLTRGPTVTFRVEQYTTTRVLRSSQKRPVDVGLAFEHPPLVVLHNFGGADAGAGAAAKGVARHEALKMAQVTFQAMFPGLNPATVKLDHCRRVFLVHHNKGTGRLELRHYLVRAVPVGVSRGVRKLAVQGKVQDLSRLDDVASFVLNNGRTGGGQTSDSEAEDESSRVQLPQSFAGRGNEKSQLSAVKLTELGPRLSLSLVKIEGGLCEGDVLYHAFVSKSAEEAAKLKARAQERVKLKAERREQQAANVAAKAKVEEQRKAAKEEKRLAKQAAAAAAAAEGRLGEGAEEDEDQQQQEDDDDADSGYDNDDREDEPEDDGSAAEDDGDDQDEDDDDDSMDGRGHGAAGASGRVDVGDSVGLDDDMDEDGEEEDDDDDDDEDEDEDGEEGHGAVPGVDGSSDDDEEDEEDEASEDGSSDGSGQAAAHAGSKRPRDIPAGKKGPAPSFAGKSSGQAKGKPQGNPQGGKPAWQAKGKGKAPGRR